MKRKSIKGFKFGACLTILLGLISCGGSGISSSSASQPTSSTEAFTSSITSSNKENPSSDSKAESSSIDSSKEHDSESSLVSSDSSVDEQTSESSEESLESTLSESAEDSFSTILSESSEEESSFEESGEETISNESSSSEQESSSSVDTTVHVTGVSLNAASITLSVGETTSLTPSITPADADDTSVSWESSNEAVATVNSRGKVTAISIGEALISVTTSDGGFIASCSVSVEEASIPVDGVTLNYEAASIYVGESITLVASVSPFNATNQAITWSSSDNSVASIDEKGTVVAQKAGQTTITVTTEDGGFTASCLMSVEEKQEESEYSPGEDETDVLSITSGGEYNVNKDYKQIYVNAPEEDVIINLNGVTISNSENSPIYVLSCGNIDISAKKGTSNYIIDGRSLYTEEEDGQGKGAIYVADGDLTLKGKGSLDVNASYYNGVHGKDDVEMKNLTLNVTAPNHGIKGADSVSVESGNVTISCGGDGLHSDNSDVSSKGNQRGNVTISGGSVNINSYGDALSAAYDAIISEENPEVPTSFTAKTGKYSSYDGETVTTSANSFYLKMNSQTYSNGNYTYAALINGEWYKANYKGTQSTTQGGGGPGGGGWGGGSNTYYIYELEKPSDANSFKLYRFSGNNVTSFSTSNYNAVSDAKAFNDAYDMVQISVRSGTISFSSWSNYASSSSVSQKGIKSENAVSISGGEITITSYDDGIHANNDGSLENGETPLGNVNISGGKITIESDDDGVHADYTLSISGGEIDVGKSYEGLEGNLIRVSGGSTYVYASDDGVNASSGKSSPNITVSGGLLDVCVPSNGDTDGIDSNGTLTISGGTTIVKGPGRASGTNMGAAAVDTDSSVSITSGSIIVFGGFERTPSSSVTRTLCSSNTVSAGAHTITFSSATYETTLPYSTSGCIVYSSLGSATLK